MRRAPTRSRWTDAGDADRGDGGNADEVAPDLRAIIAAEMDFLRAAWPRNLPEGVVHADMFPDNTLFVGRKLTGVIDFFFACSDAFAWAWRSASALRASKATAAIST